MHRRFIAIIVSAAVAVTSMTAQPVRAGDDDIAKWIAGIATIAIIGAAINEKQKKDRRKKHRIVTNPPYPDPYLLPRKCRVSRNLQGNEIRGFARGCLKRNNVNVQALPQQCKVKFRDRQLDRRVVLFTGRCLRQNGYRVARH